MIQHIHYDEGVLMALLDGALDDAVGQSVSDGVARCAVCTERLRRIHAHGTRVARWFTRDDAIPLNASPGGSGDASSRVAARSSASRWLPVAATVAILLGVSVFTPLGARVVGWIFPTASPRATQPAPPAMTNRSEIRLEDVAADFEIHLDPATPPGRLTVTVAPGPQARVVVTEGDGAESVVVGRGRVDLGAPATSAARFEVVLPPRVTAVDVWIGGDHVTPVWEPASNAIPRSWRSGR